MPQALRTKLKFVTYAVLNPSAISSAQNGYSCNSLYDPDRTGVGHQPMGFDEWGAFYKNYRVMRSHIKVTAVNSDTTATSDYVITLNLSDSSTTTSDTFEALMEQPMSKGKIVTSELDKVSLEMDFDIAKYYDRSADVSSFKAAITANPTEEAYFIVSAASIDGTDLPAINVVVEITYYAEFYGPQELGQS
jgi:hypothetical protein